MALLLIAVTWMLLLALVAGLCRAARLGDAGELRPNANADGAGGAGRDSPVVPAPGAFTAIVSAPPRRRDAQGRARAWLSPNRYAVAPVCIEHRH